MLAWKCAALGPAWTSNHEWQIGLGGKSGMFWVNIRTLVTDMRSVYASPVFNGPFLLVISSSGGHGADQYVDHIITQDIYCLNADGSLFDAALLACAAALTDCKWACLPLIEFFSIVAKFACFLLFFMSFYWFLSGVTMLRGRVVELWARSFTSKS